MPDETHSPAAQRARFAFVYGTLRQDQANDITRLRPSPRFVGTAQVRGALYDLGAYPGVVLQGAGVVHGEVYEIEPALECQLDEIEMIYPQQRDEYFKRVLAVDVASHDGAPLTLDCVIYEYNPAYLEGAPLIAEGDWVRRVGIAPRG